MFQFLYKIRYSIRFYSGGYFLGTRWTVDGVFGWFLVGLVVLRVLMVLVVLWVLVVSGVLGVSVISLILLFFTVFTCPIIQTILAKIVAAVCYYARWDE